MILNLSAGDNSVNVTQELTELEDRASVLEDELTANGQRIYLDYKDGKYGYNTDALRGADTFSPFKSGGSDSELTQLSTYYGINGSLLPTITGTGYLIIKRLTGNEGTRDDVRVYIDDNAMGFPINSHVQTLVRDGYYKFYFQKSVRFTNGKYEDTYIYQTLLADKEIPDRYNIIQGQVKAQETFTFEGKGRILISPSTFTVSMPFTIDDGEENTLQFYGVQHVEFMFNKSITFKSDSNNAPLYYLIYEDL